jgi:hypothetical protein
MEKYSIARCIAPCLLIIALVTVSSCGLFKKKCNCPHFNANVSAVASSNTIR